MADYGWSLQEDMPTPTYGQSGLEGVLANLLGAGIRQQQATTQSVAGEGNSTAGGTVTDGQTSTGLATSGGGGGQEQQQQQQQQATNPNLTAALGGMLHADNPVGADIWMGGNNFNNEGLNGNGLYNNFYNWSLTNHLTGLSPDFGNGGGGGGRGGGGGGGGHSGGASNYYYRAQDKMYHIYNPTTNEWETYSVDDLLNGHLSENMKKQHDDAWYRDNAFSLDQQHYNDVYGDALSAQRQGAASNARFKYQQQYYS